MGEVNFAINSRFHQEKKLICFLIYFPFLKTHFSHRKKGFGILSAFKSFA